MTEKHYIDSHRIHDLRMAILHAVLGGVIEHDGRIARDMPMPSAMLDKATALAEQAIRECYGMPIEGIIVLPIEKLETV